MVLPVGSSLWYLHLNARMKDGLLKPPSEVKHFKAHILILPLLHNLGKSIFVNVLLPFNFIHYLGQLQLWQPLSWSQRFAPISQI